MTQMKAKQDTVTILSSTIRHTDKLLHDISLNCVEARFNDVSYLWGLLLYCRPMTSYISRSSTHKHVFRILFWPDRVFCFRIKISKFLFSIFKSSYLEHADLVKILERLGSVLICGTLEELRCPVVCGDKSGKFDVGVVGKRTKLAFVVSAVSHRSLSTRQNHA